MTIFQMRKLGHKEVKQCASHHTVSFPSWNVSHRTRPTPVMSSKTIFSMSFVLSGAVLVGRKDLSYIIKGYGFADGPLTRWFPTGIKNDAISDVITWRKEDNKFLRLHSMNGFTRCIPIIKGR